MEERRRSLRYEIPTGQLASLPFSVTVQVVDISVEGVLLQTERRLNIGDRGSLRLTMAGSPFVADVEVTRVLQAPAAKNAYHVGASFVAITPEHRHIIERFTHQ